MNLFRRNRVDDWEFWLSETDMTYPEIIKNRSTPQLPQFINGEKIQVSNSSFLCVPAIWKKVTARAAIPLMTWIFAILDIKYTGNPTLEKAFYRTFEIKFRYETYFFLHLSNFCYKCRRIPLASWQYFWI